MFFSYISLLLMPAAFFLSFSVGLLTHLSSASFLTISLFPEALCSYAASFCGVSLRLKLSLHTLVNDFFRPAPVNAIFLNFLFFPPTGGVLSYIARCHSSVCFWPHSLFGGFTRILLSATFHYRSHSGGEFAKRGVWRAIGARAHLMHFLSLWKNSYHKCGSLFRNFIL